jgi:hypothetical protein
MIFTLFKQYTDYSLKGFIFCRFDDRALLDFSYNKFDDIAPTIGASANLNEYGLCFGFTVYRTSVWIQFLKKDEDLDDIPF